MNIFNKNVLEGSPAGLPTTDGGQQPTIGVLISTQRDQRVLDWLIAQVGQEAVVTACNDLAGARKTFPSNIAKKLGLVVPDVLVLTPKDDALKRISEIHSLLSRGR